MYADDSGSSSSATLRRWLWWAADCFPMTGATPSSLPGLSSSKNCLAITTCMTTGVFLLPRRAGRPTGSTSRRARWSRPTGAKPSYCAFDTVLDDEPVRQGPQSGGQGANHQSDVEGMSVIEQPPGDQRRQ